MTVVVSRVRVQARQFMRAVVSTQSITLRQVEPNIAHAIGPPSLHGRAVELVVSTHA
jgi:hypothetical protein